MPQDWQLLTAHENGMLQVRFGILLLLLLFATAVLIASPRRCPGTLLMGPSCLLPPVQVWGSIGGTVQPLMQIGDRCASALTLVVCEPLDAVITAHQGG